ncbi:MAG: alcohol dehydrogenase [Deltaproteobacteria bacterium]|nr:alcohol dehydrogenase [Deltaproteobacteria bacterium]
MAKMRAVQVTTGGQPFEIVERDIPEPGPGTVRLRVQACGVCHSDVLTREALWAGLQLPRIPGHEVIGAVDKLGDGVVGWKIGERAGVGWNGGYCGYCNSCRRGEFFACLSATRVTGITADGGYADYIVARAEALARVPDGLSAAEAAPLMCAGVTTFNALRNSGARAGDLVAVLGLGGLGHLGVQFAAKMGFRTIAIARGQDKAALAAQLGAHEYIDNQSQDPAAELAKRGGARIVLATVTAGDAMTATIGGLRANGTLMVLGAAGPLQIDALQLIPGALSLKGWYSGTSIDSEDTLNFSLLSGVRSMNEAFPLARAEEAYQHMLSGKARFRAVLTMDA